MNQSADGKSIFMERGAFSDVLKLRTKQLAPSREKFLVACMEESWVTLTDIAAVQKIGIFEVTAKIIATEKILRRSKKTDLFCAAPRSGIEFPKRLWGETILFVSPDVVSGSSQNVCEPSDLRIDRASLPLFNL